MINFVEDIFSVDVQAFVNTVNLVGVMGKGIALECRKRWPDHYFVYQYACLHKEIGIGKVLVVPTGIVGSELRYIICFPTKVHWKNPSQYKWISDGLVDLRRVVLELGVKSIAMPKLGCTNGGLEWRLVLPMIEGAFKDLDVVVYLPKG